MAGNAITPDVSLVFTQVSVCIDNEHHCLYQPLMRQPRYVLLLSASEEKDHF